MALMTKSHFISKAIYRKVLLKRDENISRNLVSGSKRYLFGVKPVFCPNFWEFMSIMRDEIDNFESIVLTHIR